MKNLLLIIGIALMAANCQPSKTEISRDPIDTNTAYEITKSFLEPVDKVYSSFIDSAMLKRIWNLSSITVDARPEEKTLAVMTVNNVDWSFNMTYKEVVTNEKLRWLTRFDNISDKEIMTTIWFQKTKTGTNIILRQENFSDPAERDENKKAWESALTLMEALISWH
jgi:uncharacterized protein YndB with AHSA1/START domain